MSNAIHKGLKKIQSAQCVSGNNIDDTVSVCVVGGVAYRLAIRPTSSVPSEVLIEFTGCDFSLIICRSNYSAISFETIYKELGTNERREAFIKLITNLPILLDKLAGELMLEVHMFCSLCEIAVNPR